MAQILAVIEDPLARNDTDAPRLIIGEYLEVAIEGEAIENVLKVDRDYVRDDDTVWTMKDEKLVINDVEIPFRDADYAYVSDGLEDGAKIVTTNIASVKDGAPLRLRSEAEAKGDGASEEGASTE